MIGAVLIFGLLIIAFSMYHSTFVPNEFKTTEIDHNEEVQGDLLQLSDKIRGTATNGVDSSQTISYGGQYDVWTAYPSPPLFGATRTPNGTVTFKNVTVTNNNESNDYWDTQKKFSTYSIRYEPSYREYQNPPATVIEHGNVYNNFSDAQLDVSSQKIVSNDSVSLILIGGDLNETSGGSKRVSVNSVSSSDSTTQINGEFSFIIPTDREESYWEYLDDRSIVGSYDYRGDEVAVTLDAPNPISLRITRVSFDSKSNSVEYITIENSEVITKDQYGNPIDGVEVNVDKTGETYFSSGDGTVDIPDPSQTIYPNIDDNSSDQEFVTVESGDLNSGASSNSPPTADFDINPGKNKNFKDLDASPSSDSDGSIVEYQWDTDNDGQYDDATGKTVDNEKLGSGDVVSLRVTDNDGATDTRDKTVQ